MGLRSCLCSHSYLVPQLYVTIYTALQLHLNLNYEGHWGTTNNFTSTLIHFSLFLTALWDLANSRPVHSLMLFSHLFLLSVLSSSPFQCALEDGFCWARWTADMSIQLQFASLCGGSTNWGTRARVSCVWDVGLWKHRHIPVGPCLLL